MFKKSVILTLGLLLICMSVFLLAQQDTTLTSPASKVSEVQPDTAASSQTGGEQNSAAGVNQAQQAPVSTWVILGSITFLIAVLAAVLAYMFYLQRKFLKACEEENQLPIFLNAPAGLPPGTVRNVLAFLVVVFLLFITALQAFRVAPNFYQSSLSFLESQNGWLILSIIILSLVVGGVFLYTFRLQKQFLKACQEEDQLSLFSNAPAGIPIGSVRSILTFLIIVFALYLFAIQAFIGKEKIMFPDALAAILSAIIGFYFGSRSASKGEDAGLEAEEEKLKEAKQAQYEGKAQSLVKDVNSKLKTAQVVMNFLPEDLRKKFSPALDKAASYAGTAENLLENEAFSKAVDKAGDAVNVFKKDNPIREIVSKAAKSFGGVVSGIPPLAIIGAVVGVSGVLAGVAYNRWRARILNAPFSPSIAPLKSVDADTGYYMLLNVPQLKEAFREQLEKRDGPFLEKTVQDFIQAETFDIWPEYQQYFDSVETFEEGVQQFRMLAATDQLEGEIDPSLLSEVGGYKPLMQSIDAIRNDPQAGPDLDLLMEVTGNLKKTQTDEPLHKIFDDARKEVENES